MSDELKALDTGIYFGWCELKPQVGKSPNKVVTEADKEIYFNYGQSLAKKDTNVLPMVMSVGWNPFYNNSEKAAEVHIMHKFTECFYGAEIKLIILGYIRPELNYTTKGAYSKNQLSATY